MTVHDDRYWNSVAAAFGGRMAQSENMGRASVPMSRGWEQYRRFNVNAEPVWITDADGTPRWLTQTQSRIASALLAACDAGAVTWTRLAAELKVSVSTVSRTAVKLMAYGIVAYVTGRGRYGGTIIIRRGPVDGLDRFRKAAKVKVRAWSLALQRRISRTKFNVATYIPSTTYGVSNTVTDTGNVMVATLTPQLSEWTPDELRSAGIL